MIAPKFLSLATFIAVAVHISGLATAHSEQVNPLASLGNADPLSMLMNSIQSQKSQTDADPENPLASMMSSVVPIAAPPPDMSIYHTVPPRPRWGAAAAFVPSANAVVISGGQTDTHSTLTNETWVLDMSGLQDLQRSIAASQVTPWLKVQRSNHSESVPPLAYASAAVSSNLCPGGSQDTFYVVGGKTEYCKTDLAPIYSYSLDLVNSTLYGTWRSMKGKGQVARRTHAKAVMPPRGLGNDRSKSMIVLGGENWDEVCHDATPPAKTREPTMDVWSLPEPYGETCRGTLQSSNPLLKHNATAHQLQFRERLASVPLSDYAAVALPEHLVNQTTRQFSEPVMFLGGRDYKNRLVSFHKPWVLDTATGRWERWVTAGDVPPPRVGHTAVHLSDGTVMVYGGYKQNSAQGVSNEPTDETFLLNPNVTPAHWSRVKYAPRPANGPEPSARAFHSATVVEDVMVVAFGQQYKSTAYGLEKRGGTNVNASEPLVMYLETRPTAMQWRWTDKLSAVVAGRVTASFLGVEMGEQAGNDANGDASAPGQGSFGNSGSVGAVSIDGSRTGSHGEQGAAGEAGGTGAVPNTDGSNGQQVQGGNGASGSHGSHGAADSADGAKGAGAQGGHGSQAEHGSQGAHGSQGGAHGAGSSDANGSHGASGSNASHSSQGNGSNSGSGSGSDSDSGSGSGKGSDSNSGSGKGSGKGSDSGSGSGSGKGSNGSGSGPTPSHAPPTTTSFPDMIPVSGTPAQVTGFAGAPGAGSGSSAAPSKGKNGKGKSSGSEGTSATKGPEADGGWSPPSGSTTPISDPTTAAPSPTGAAGQSSSGDASPTGAADKNGKDDKNGDHNGHNNGESTARTGAIAGGVIGAAALAVGAVIGGLYAYRKRRESQQITMLRSNGVVPKDRRDDPEFGSAPPVSSLWLQQPMNSAGAEAEPYGRRSNMSGYSMQGHAGTPLSASPVGGRSMATDASRHTVRGPRDTHPHVPSSLAAGGAAAGLGAAAAGGYAAHEYYSPQNQREGRTDSNGSHCSYPYLSGMHRASPEDSNQGLDHDAPTDVSTSVDTHGDSDSLYSNSVDGKTVIHGEEQGMRTAPSFRFPETRAQSPKPMSYPIPRRDQQSSTLRVMN
ncbi:uncharacterized protein MJAP1_001160 [Malassezia japonica]|uniref:Kelch repeat-containing protein n=1 Tax=Malassezia japonica TaxID=223818 RepID=A0AAF0F4G3_9BASI|nr:uncharacterized protein MJAP1_001160 [Malassezia japonica]WFD38212.1 hypothetical protein MJAP1_001160 [Malassezia japonica]